MREFSTAVREEEVEGTEEAGRIAFKHDGREVVFYEPSTGQQALMLTMGRKDKKEAGRFIALFFEMMDEDTQSYFESRLLDRKDTFDLDGEGGILDIFEFLIEEWSGKDITQPSDYQPPRKATGRASTAPTRAKASTSSRSRSRASST